MKYKELGDYIKAVSYAQREVPEIKVLLGLECEYIEKYENYLREELLGKLKFKYLIGAAHYTPYNGGWINSFTELGSVYHLKKYSEYVCQMMETNIFSFIAVSNNICISIGASRRYLVVQNFSLSFQVSVMQ